MDGSATDSPDPPAAPSRVLSRRSVLISAGVVVLAGAGGVTAATKARLRHRAVPQPPATLVAALDSEDALIAGIDAAATGTEPDAVSRQFLAQLRADHVEHRRVLAGLISAATGSSYSPTPYAGAGATPRNRASLRRAERQAARDGASRAARLHGEHAALLASIAACEASHGDLLA